MDQENSSTAETTNSLSLKFNQYSPPETPELSDFGSQFLTNVPEEDRPILEKYVKEWDGNVTRKFQEYSGKLSKYEELGDVTDLTNAYQVLNDLRTDPVGFFEYYRDYLVENANDIQEIYGVENLLERIGAAMDQEMGNQSPLPEFQGLPEPAVEKITQLENQLNQALEKLNTFESSQREREQMQMLDSTLANLHNTHGDFDETFVLSQIAGGKTPDQAIEAYNNLKQSIIDSHGESAPDLLSGPAGTPLDQVDMTKLKDAKTRKELGAKLLERSLRA